jgi:hypothetical protein
VVNVDIATQWSIRILLLCSIYDPVSNLSFTESLEMSLPVWQLTLNNGWIFPFSRFSNVRNVSPLYNGSWFVGIKHLHRKYELKEAISYLDEPESKTKWTLTVKEAVYRKWVGSSR